MTQKLLSIAVILLGLTSSAFADEVISSGQPSAAEIQTYADDGVQMIIDLRTESEDRGIDEPALVEASGMKYVSFPISRADITFAKAAVLDKLLESTDEPIVVHCASGNRVGALMALRASLNGASDKEALKIGKSNGMTRLSPVVEALLENAP